MGVIQRQGTKNSIVLYFGVLVGGLSTLFIYPLDFGTYGLIQTCFDLVVFLAPVVTFGATYLTLRFFPSFKLKGEDDQGFLGFLIVVNFLAMLMAAILLTLFGNSFIAFLEELSFDLAVFRKYQSPLLVLLVLYVFILVLDNYIRNYNRIVVQTLFTNLLPKIGLPILILMIYYEKVDESEFVWGYVAIYGLVLLGLIFYAKLVTPFNLKISRSILRQSSLLREMRVYALYSLFGSMGAVLATQMDSLMITALVDTTNTGVYKVTAFMAVVIEIPARSLRAIATPIIAKAWEARNFDEIAQIYRRSSAVLGFVGTAIYVLISISIVDIVSWTPNPTEILANLSVFYVLGAVKLIDLFTGANGQIITFSSYYRFNIIAVLILAVFNLVFNYVFLVYLEWGLLGVAMATFISLTLYNVAKFLFIQFRLKLQPFSWETIKILVLGLIGFGVSFLPVNTGFSLVDVVIRSLLGSSVFGLGLWYWGVCPEIKEMVINAWNLARDKWMRFRN